MSLPAIMIMMHIGNRKGGKGFCDVGCRGEQEPGKDYDI